MLGRSIFYDAPQLLGPEIRLVAQGLVDLLPEDVDLGVVLNSKDIERRSTVPVLVPPPRLPIVYIACSGALVRTGMDPPFAPTLAGIETLSAQRHYRHYLIMGGT